MKKQTIALVIASMTLLVLSCALRQTRASKPPTRTLKTVGWVENAQVLGMEQPTRAKLDTGATTTSLNAEILERPESTSETGGMIKFRLIDDEENNPIYERSVVRWVKIKDGNGGFFRRPVVMMNICIAGRWVEGEANLADRDQFNYSVLIGRNMLEKGGLAIDSSQSFSQEPNCPSREEES